MWLYTICDKSIHVYFKNPLFKQLATLNYCFMFNFKFIVFVWKLTNHSSVVRIEIKFAILFCKCLLWKILLFKEILFFYLFSCFYDFFYLL